MIGYVWAADRRNKAEHLLRLELTRLSQWIREKAADAPSKAERKALFDAAKSLQTRGALTKALPEIQAHPAVTLCVEDFDQDDWVLNTPAGIVDLRTGDISPPDPTALCSKTTAVAPVYTPPERWLSFLAEVTDGDEDLQRYLHKLAGYALTGSTQEQVLAFVHGPPLTGKTVFLETLAGVFGTYHVTTDANTFASSRGDRHPADIAALAGARLVTASETQEGRGWDTQRVKTLTGGDEVSARFMRQDFFTYRPRYQIVIVGNHEPEIEGVDAALMRRLHVIPFEHRPAEPDRLLFERLKVEWPAILGWAIQGSQTWLKEGLTPPAVVLARTEQYRQEEDPVGLFLEECCDLSDPSAEISRRKLYRAWSQWCHGQGEDAGTLKQLKRRFRGKRLEHGWQDIRMLEDGQMRNGYRGLCLHDDTIPLLEDEDDG